jgi:hypothetical protein
MLKLLQITIRNSQGSHHACARLRLLVLRGKNPQSTSLFHCTDLDPLKWAQFQWLRRRPNRLASEADGPPQRSRVIVLE